MRPPSAPSSITKKNHRSPLFLSSSSSRRRNFSPRIILKWGAVAALTIFFASRLFLNSADEDYSWILNQDTLSAMSAASTSTSESSISTNQGRQPDRAWDPAKSVVMGLAVGYGLEVFRLFVGSLRATGFPGQIHLGIGANAAPEVLEYLKKQHVKVHIVHFADHCTYENALTVDGHPSKYKKCPREYPDYKISWGRFPLYRDWLLSCGDDCTDGVMLTDVRDAFFQRDPFAAMIRNDKPPPLLVFEEHPDTSTEHWLTDVPVRKCCNYTLGKHPMLCSGSTMGSRQGILDYIQVMIQEFDYWKTRVECRSDMAGDDQSIHNHLFYSGKLSKDAVAVPHRMGPIHVVGYQADLIFRAAIRKAHEQDGHGKDLREAENWINDHRFHYDGSTDIGSSWRRWLSPDFNLTHPDTGHIVNYDGLPSAQVHQHDRFGRPFEVWLNPMINEWNKEL